MLKKHQITMDFSKGRIQGQGTGSGVYVNPSPSTVSLGNRTAPAQGGFGSKGIRYGSIPAAPSISKVKSGLGRQATMCSTATVPGGGGGDQTVCQYCGVSYLTIAEMRSLKAQVKEQSERLLHHKELQSENIHLKEAIGNLRQTHHNELMKYEAEVQWMKGQCRGLENQVESLQGGSSGRSNTKDDLTATLIHEKMNVLESAVRKIILNPHLKDKPETDNLISRLEEVNRIIAQGQISASGDFSNNHAGENFGTDVEVKRRGKSESRARSGTAITRKVSSLNAVEIHDLRRENNVLVEKIRNLTAENSNCQEMHANLRETLDKLKNDNAHLHEEMNSLRVQYEESLVTNENLEAQLKGQRTENDRLRSFSKEMELRLRGADEQNRNLKNSVDQTLVERLQTTLTGLKKQIQEHQVQTEKVRADFQQKLAEAQRETAMEKERADSCLAASLLERQDVERRWDERWGRHQASLTEQLDSLRSNYEKTLASVRVHEESLQKEVTSLRDKLEKSKETWEGYRKSLSDQVANWKAKYEQKQSELEAASKSKVDVELLYQEKSAEMESLHEIIREGCEERQDLQRQVSAMKENFEEVRLQGQSCFPPNRLSGPSPTPMRNSLLSEAAQEGYCSYSQLKEKAQQQNQQNRIKASENLEQIASGFAAPPPTSNEATLISNIMNEVYLPPPSAPTSPSYPRPQMRPGGGISNLYKEKPVQSLDAFPFTIGRGKRTPQKPSTAVPKPVHHPPKNVKKRAPIQNKPLRKRDS